jgi:plastocyanin domain-containing protein
MSNRLTKVLVIVSIPVFLIAGYLTLKVSTLKDDSNSNSTLGTSVSDSNGKQIIEIKAKAGYSPASVIASANKDTILRVTTDSTFDCSSALTIPKLGIQKNLQPTATIDIPLGSQTPGTKLAGTCAMGMYNFSLSFN